MRFSQVTVIRGSIEYGSSKLCAYDVICSKAKNESDTSFIATYRDYATYATDESGQYIIVNGEKKLVSKYSYPELLKYSYSELLDYAPVYIERK